jgi:hypothetical protein
MISQAANVSEALVSEQENRFSKARKEKELEFDPWLTLGKLRFRHFQRLGNFPTKSLKDVV